MAFCFPRGDRLRERRLRKSACLRARVAAALNSLRRFECENVLYKIHYQIIELNSYGKALFPDFVPLSVQSEEVCFVAEGVTCLDNSLSTLKMFLDPRHMPGCNHAVNVILMSDGFPTDPDGYVLEADVYGKTVGDFKSFLEKSGLRAGVDLYSIGVGEEVCEDMLRTFADEGKYYKVEELESLAEKLDFVTRKSLFRLSSHRVSVGGDDGNQGHGNNAQSADSALEEDSVMTVNAEICLGGACLSCVDSCIASAIDYVDGEVKISAELCNGCGVCAERCPCTAIVSGDSV